MVKYFSIQNGSLKPSSETGNIRLHIAPTSDEIKSLKTNSAIDEHTLSSALDPDEVPRIEIEPDHFVVIWKIPHRFTTDGSTFLFEVVSIAVFVFRDSMEIIVPDDEPLLEGRYFNRVSNVLDVLLRLLSRTISHFLSHLKVIDTISNEIKQKVNTSMENRYLLQMFDLSESLVYYLNAISSNGAVLDKLRISSSRIGLVSNELELL